MKQGLVHGERCRLSLQVLLSGSTGTMAGRKIIEAKKSFESQKVLLGV